VAQPQNVNSGLVATAGLVTVFAVTALIIATHGWYHHQMDAELELKSQKNWDPTIPDAIAKAKSSLTPPKDSGQITIDEAMNQYIQSQKTKGKTAQAPETGTVKAQ
jgi:hypothetical protein